MAPVQYGPPTSLDFILVSTTNTLPEAETETIRLQNRMLSGLRETELFNEVELTNTNPVATNGIQIQATIKQMTPVSEESRQWFGGFAGKARVVVHVTITDLMTGKPIEVFEVGGQTGASAWAGTTDEAVERAADNVVEEIKRLNAESARPVIDGSGSRSW